MSCVYRISFLDVASGRRGYMARNTVRGWTDILRVSNIFSTEPQRELYEMYDQSFYFHIILFVAAICFGCSRKTETPIFSVYFVR